MALDIGRDVGRTNSADPQGEPFVRITAPADTLANDVWVLAAIGGCSAASLSGTGFSFRSPVSWSSDGTPSGTVIEQGGILLDVVTDSGFLFSVSIFSGLGPGEYIQASQAPDLTQWSMSSMRIRGADPILPLCGQSALAFGTDADPSIVTVPTFDVEVDDATLVWIMGGSFVGTNPVTAQPAGIDRIGAINTGVGMAYSSFSMMGVSAVAAGPTAALVSGGVPKSPSFAWNCRAGAMALAIRPIAVGGVRFVGTDAIVATEFALPT